MLSAGRFWCLSAVAAGCCVVAGCVPIAAMDPAEVVAGLSDLILQPETSCAELRERFQVEMTVVDNPSEAGFIYQEIRVPVDESNSLRVWYLPAEQDLGTVIFSMGDAGNMACYLFSANLLVKNGWSVVMYDYQGFGGSNGAPSLYSLSRDLRAVIDWTRSATACEQVTLMGMSLGSIPSVALAVEYPEAVNAVILDSPIGLRTQIVRFGFLVAGQSAPIISRLTADMLSEDIIGGLTQPLLIFAHERDFISTPSSVKLLFERAAGPKELVFFPELGHASGQFIMTDYYVFYLVDFLTQVWHVNDPVAAAAE